MLRAVRVLFIQSEIQAEGFGLPDTDWSIIEAIEPTQHPGKVTVAGPRAAGAEIIRALTERDIENTGEQVVVAAEKFPLRRAGWPPDWWPDNPSTPPPEIAWEAPE